LNGLILQLTAVRMKERRLGRGLLKMKGKIDISTYKIAAAAFEVLALVRKYTHTHTHSLSLSLSLF